MSGFMLYIFFSVIRTITLQGRVRISYKKSEGQGSYLPKPTNLLSQSRLKSEFDPEVHICPFYHLIAFFWVSYRWKPDTFYRFVLVTSHFSLT